MGPGAAADHPRRAMRIPDNTVAPPRRNSRLLFAIDFHANGWESISQPGCFWRRSQQHTFSSNHVHSSEGCYPSQHRKHRAPSSCAYLQISLSKPDGLVGDSRETIEVFAQDIGPVTSLIRVGCCSTGKERIPRAGGWPNPRYGPTGRLPSGRYTSQLHDATTTQGPVQVSGPGSR